MEKGRSVVPRPDVALGDPVLRGVSSRKMPPCARPKTRRCCPPGPWPSPLSTAHGHLARRREGEGDVARSVGGDGLLPYELLALVSGRVGEELDLEGLCGGALKRSGDRRGGR